mmetsp:Transcript_43083/g.136099  ORF Transcript_43083/g.136099 Transcript_43083/m.136099 type:complete len:535 (-) Transcript_43083:1971-3575(-)
MISQRQLIGLALGVLVLWNFLLFPAFHGASEEPHDDTVLSDWGESEESRMTYDSFGFEWAPVLDRNVIRCENLEKLSEWKGEVLKREAEDEARWKGLDCEGRLRRQHVEAVPLRRSKFGKVCTKLRAQLNTSDVSQESMEESLPPSLAGTWRSWQCSCYFDRKCHREIVKRRVPAIHSSMTAKGIAASVQGRRRRERLQPSGKKQVVATVLGSTSINVKFRTLEDNPLFTKLLPSLRRTMDGEFEYWVLVGYDTGDLFYDDERTLTSLKKWFRRNVEAPSKEKGIDCKLIFLNFTNVLRKPGPVFNFVAASAVSDGADFLFRVNDDTEIASWGWASKMSSTLAGMSPSLLGVVGPSGRGDSSSEHRYMLTHDFVHRTHMRIFETYYPPVLSDWWMDDWISRVYGRSRTRKLGDVLVVHHTEVVASFHGTDAGDPVRYAVDWAHKKYLEHEVHKGSRRIKEFVRGECEGGECPEKSERRVKRGGNRQDAGTDIEDENTWSRGTAEDDDALLSRNLTDLDERLYGNTEKRMSMEPI